MDAALMAETADLKIVLRKPRLITLACAGVPLAFDFRLAFAVN